MGASPLQAWSERETATLVKLWREGLSASEIAAQLPGRTRSAVIGRAYRLKLPHRGQQPLTAQRARVMKRARLKAVAIKPKPERQRNRFKPRVAPPERMPNKFDATLASQAALALLGAASAADRRRDLYRSNALGRTQ